MLGAGRRAQGGRRQEIPLIVSVTKQENRRFYRRQSGEHATSSSVSMQKAGLLTTRGRDIIFYPSKLRALQSPAE